MGNSLAVRIPRKVAEDLGLGDDSNVEIISNGKSMTIKPGTQPRALTLEAMLDGVTPGQVGGEIDWGADAGAERWYEN
jgi:antitoxin MazE